MSENTMSAERLAEVAHINLRGDPENTAFRKAVETALGQPLPVDANTMSDGVHRVFWLGPDEWLVMTSSGKRPELLAALNDGLAGMHAAVNDVSGGNVALRLSGSGVRELLAKGCTLDFHPDIFSVGMCAQSGLGKASVLFGLIDDAPTFEIVVRSSFSDYLVRWLEHAGGEYGIEFG